MHLALPILNGRQAQEQLVLFCSFTSAPIQALDATVFIAVQAGT